MLGRDMALKFKPIIYQLDSERQFHLMGGAGGRDCSSCSMRSPLKMLCFAGNESFPGNFHFMGILRKLYSVHFDEMIHVPRILNMRK